MIFTHTTMQDALQAQEFLVNAALAAYAVKWGGLPTDVDVSDEPDGTRRVQLRHTPSRFRDLCTAPGVTVNMVRNNARAWAPFGIAPEDCEIIAAPFGCPVFVVRIRARDLTTTN